MDRSLIRPTYAQASIDRSPPIDHTLRVSSTPASSLPRRIDPTRHRRSLAESSQASTDCFPAESIPCSESSSGSGGTLVDTNHSDSNRPWGIANGQLDVLVHCLQIITLHAAVNNKDQCFTDVIRKNLSTDQSNNWCQK